MQNKILITVLLLFTITVFQPASAHASFFLFNIVRDIFGGGQHHDSPTSKPNSSNNSNSSLIKFGMQNSQVAEIQQYLIKGKYLSGKSDGIFGYQTLQAVKMFQRDSGLSDDGVVGSRTMNALKNFKSTKPKRTSPPSQKPSYHPPHDNGVPHYLYATPMLATAYTRYDEGCTDYTYRGTYLRKGLAAVDPDVIPLGTKLYIPGYGEAIADDIGGAIIGNHVDLAMDTLDEAFSWGKRDVTVYVLPRG